MTGKDIISVVIPVFNGERYLAAAIESVLAQWEVRTEIVVVDDGSTDQSAAVVRDYPEISLIEQVNQGNAVARNIGIQNSTGGFIAFLDQDDYWAPTKLAKQLHRLREISGTGLCLCYQQFFVEDGLEIPRWLQKLLAPHPGYVPGAWLVSREVLERVGRFNPKLSHGSDTDWLFRARDLGIETARLEETLLFRRCHSRNLSHQVDTARDQMLRLVRSSIQRKRGQT